MHINRELPEFKNKEEAILSFCKIANSECLDVESLWCYFPIAKKFGITYKDFIAILPESPIATMNGMQTYKPSSEFTKDELIDVLYRESYKKEVWNSLCNYNRLFEFKPIIEIPATWEELETLIADKRNRWKEEKASIDFYLWRQNCLDRLIDEFYKYGSIIISYDFDDTLNDFHKVGREYNLVMKLLRDLKPYAKFICFTASKEERYPEIWKYIEDHAIPIDKMNQPIEGTPEGVKIYANIHLDDRAGLGECYLILKSFLEIIKEHEEVEHKSLAFR